MKKMSRVLGVLLASAMLAFVVGCPESDDDDDLAGGDIRGTWNYDGAKMKGGPLNTTINVTTAIARTLELWSNATATGASSTSGTLSGTYYTNSGSGAFAGTWSVSGNQLTVTYEGRTRVFTFGVEGNKLTIVGEEDYLGSRWTVTIELNR
jgi:hypothetical protein